MDRQLRWNEELHVFRADGFATFSHCVRPVWSKSAADERFVESMTVADVEFWFHVHALPRLSLDDQINFFRMIGLRELENESDFYVFDPTPKPYEL